MADDELLCGGGPQHDMDISRRGLCRDCDSVRELLADARRETARECLAIAENAFHLSVKDWRRKRIIKQIRERFGLEDGDETQDPS